MALNAPFKVSTARHGVASPLPRLPARISIRSSPADTYAREIVVAAFIRSFTAAQVVDGHAPAACVVWTNPADEARVELAALLAAGGKAVVFGRIGPGVAEVLGVEFREQPGWLSGWADCPLEPKRHHDTSPASIRYHDCHPLARWSPFATRPLCRFDFSDEWNNLGFGRVRVDGSSWSIQSSVEAGDAVPIASLVTPQGESTLFAALKEDHRGAALWFNRPVGPVDSLEWSIVESFLSHYRSNDLPCLPCVAEIPHGYSGAVCARLDCDEAVATSRPLFEMYRDRGLPLTLALLTGQPIGPDDIELMRAVIAARGAVVSHSVRHEPNWGGSYARARDEARQSRAWLEEHLPESAPARYAVSPFHQNPTYAVAALADSGYEGFVGGIIANDPEYLLGRAGRVPFAPRPIVSLSAQCMLHGDCYRRYDNTIDVYRESFEAHRAARSTFAYLDHPFSPRYQYGWESEAARIAAHEALIEHVAAHPDIWWANAVEVLEFLRQRDATRVEVRSDDSLSVECSLAGPRRPLAVLFKGTEYVY